MVSIQDSGLKSTNKGVLTKLNWDRKEGVQEAKKVEKKEVGVVVTKFLFIIINRQF